MKKLFLSSLTALFLNSCSICNYTHFDSYITPSGDLKYKGCVECKTNVKDIQKSIIKFKH
jgi:hypothetical protein